MPAERGWDPNSGCRVCPPVAPRVGALGGAEGRAPVPKAWLLVLTWEEQSGSSGSHVCRPHSSGCLRSAPSPRCSPPSFPGGSTAPDSWVGQGEPRGAPPGAGKRPAHHGQRVCSSHGRPVRPGGAGSLCACSGVPTVNWHTQGWLTGRRRRACQVRVPHTRGLCPRRMLVC